MGRSSIRGSRARAFVMTEFLMLLPLFVLFLFLIIQIAMAMLAKMTVAYASFTAARAAVVVLPAGESPDKVRLAAAYPLASISPRLPGGGALGYARRATAVRISPARPAWNGQVTVQVAYLFDCFMPMAAQLACKPYDEAREGWSFDGSFPGRYLLLRAQHTLTNQGRP